MFFLHFPSATVKVDFCRNRFTIIFQVVDGTSCDLRDGLPRICVEGECRPIGCDGMLGSQVSDSLSGSSSKKLDRF
jgi:hypothetical protein